jgi:hypothetical protein
VKSEVESGEGGWEEAQKGYLGSGKLSWVGKLERGIEEKTYKVLSLFGSGLAVLSAGARGCSGWSFECWCEVGSGRKVGRGSGRDGKWELSRGWKVCEKEGKLKIE